MFAIQLYPYNAHVNRLNARSFNDVSPRDESVSKYFWCFIIKANDRTLPLIKCRSIVTTSVA